MVVSSLIVHNEVLIYMKEVDTDGLDRVTIINKEGKEIEAILINNIYLYKEDESDKFYVSERIEEVYERQEI